MFLPCSPCCGGCTTADLTSFYSTLSSSDAKLSFAGTSVERGAATIIQNCYKVPPVGIDYGRAVVYRATSSPPSEMQLALVPSGTSLHSDYAQVRYAFQDGDFEAVFTARLSRLAIDIVSNQVPQTSWLGGNCGAFVELRVSQTVRTDIYDSAGRLLGSPAVLSWSLNGSDCTMRYYPTDYLQSLFTNATSSLAGPPIGRVAGGWALDKSVAGVTPDFAYSRQRHYWWRVNYAWTVNGSTPGQIVMVGPEETATFDGLPRFRSTASGGWYGSLSTPTHSSSDCRWSVAGTQQSQLFNAIDPAGDSGLQYTPEGEHAQSSYVPTVTFTV